MTIILTLILGLIAVLHALWGLEIWVPIRDEEQLARATVGAKGVTRMPGTIPCFLVVFGLVVIMVALWVPLKPILWIAAAVFGLRGGLAYTRLWRQMTPEQPFATYDQKYYAPLCLALAAGLLITLLGGS